MHKLSYKTLLIIFFSLLIAVVILSRFVLPKQKVSAAWWNDSWSYRQAINISAHTAAESNVYIIASINIGTTTKAQVDDGDFRFVDQSGNLLSCYISSGVGTTNITFHIQFSSFPAGAQTIYAYYGNSSVINGFSSSDFATEATNYTIGSYNTEETGGGPIAYYKFDEGVGNTAYDSQGNNNGTINGASWSNQGKYNKGLNFSSSQESLLLNYKVWKVGQTGSATGFSQNGSTSENFRVLDTDPFGRKVAVWQAAQNDVTSDADGGWASSNIAVDQTKMYRFSTWIRRTVLGNGSYYLGTYGKNSGGTNIGIMTRSIGTTTTNPYFRSAAGSGILSTDSWFLLVGHVWPVDSGTGPVFSDTGLYDSSGTKIATPIDFVWLDGTALTVHRSYLYSSTDSSTVQQWAYPRVDVVDGTEPSIQDLLNGHDSYGNDVYLNISDTKESFSFWYDKNSTGNWQHIAKSSSNYYVNGQPGTPSEYPIYVSGNDVYIGRTTDSDFATGSIDEVKIYPYARTAAQIKLDYNSRGASSGSSVNLGIKSSTAPPIKSKLVAYWKLDENNGNTIFSSISSNNGTFGAGSSAPTWTIGKYNNGLSFTGTNYVNLPNDIVTTSTIRTQGITYSAWIKPNSVSTSRILGQKPSSGYNDFSSGGLGINSNGKALMIAYDDGVAYKYATSNTTLSTGQWYHLVGVYDPYDQKIKIYVNGKNDGTDVSISTFSRILANATNTIGNQIYVTPLFYNGLIDEVKIYNAALTPEEIKQDYNQGSTIQFGSTNQTIGGTTTSLEYCIPGDASACSPPIAEWNFEEGIGNTTYDSSGNNNNGNWSGTGSHWTSGKIGSAGLFNGSDSYVNGGTGASLNISTAVTTESWVNINNLPSNWVNILGKGGQWNTSNYNILLYNNGTIRTTFQGVTGGDYTFSSVLATKQWYHVATVYDGSTLKLYLNGLMVGSTQATGTMTTNASDLNIGRQEGYGGSYIDGKIDNVRIYNYARTPAQVAYDYNKGDPVGWWKFDECQGLTAFDSSGLGNTGAINIGPSGTQNSLGTCQVGTSAAWTNGASGKTNSSLSFDGTDDYIQIPQYTYSTNASLSVWVKGSYSNGSQIIIGSKDSITLGLYNSSGNKIIGYASNGTSKAQGDVGNLFIDNNWNHLVVTFDSSGNANYYCNGKLLANNGVNYWTWTDNTAYIGKRTIGSNFKGQIDDVRIYNYALTAEQIKVLYNGGSVNFN